MVQTIKLNELFALGEKNEKIIISSTNNDINYSIRKRT